MRQEGGARQLRLAHARQQQDSCSEPPCLAHAPADECALRVNWPLLHSNVQEAVGHGPAAILSHALVKRCALHRRQALCSKRPKDCAVELHVGGAVCGGSSGGGGGGGGDAGCLADFVSLVHGCRSWAGDRRVLLRHQLQFQCSGALPASAGCRPAQSCTCCWGLQRPKGLETSRVWGSEGLSAAGLAELRPESAVDAHLAQADEMRTHRRHASGVVAWAGGSRPTAQ